MPVEQLVDGRARARVAALVDLAEQPRRATFSACAAAFGPGGDHLDEVVAPACVTGSMPGVDAHAQRAAGQLVDRAPRCALATAALARVMTRAYVRPLRHNIVSRDAAQGNLRPTCCRWSEAVGRVGLEPTT